MDVFSNVAGNAQPMRFGNAPGAEAQLAAGILRLQAWEAANPCGCAFCVDERAAAAQAQADAPTVCPSCGYEDGGCDICAPAEGAP